MPEDDAAGRARGRGSRVRFVLVEPQHPGNVGAAARALKNLGFSRLELVRPVRDPRSAEARAMAVDAADLLDRAGTHDDLDAALAGAATVIGTSGRTGKQRKPHWRLDALAPEIAGFAAAGEIAVVFGRESHGLRDTELDRCTHLVYFPSSADYPSFNLAQSVLLAAYEVRLALDGPPAAAVAGAGADHASREAMYAHLEGALRAIGFVSDQTSEPMMRRLRRMLGRAALTAEDVTVVRGIARQVLWCAARAGLIDPQEAERTAAAPPDRP